MHFGRRFAFTQAHAVRCSLFIKSWELTFMVIAFYEPVVSVAYQLAIQTVLNAVNDTMETNNDFDMWLTHPVTLRWMHYKWLWMSVSAKWLKYKCCGSFSLPLNSVGYCLEWTWAVCVSFFPGHQLSLLSILFLVFSFIPPPSLSLLYSPLSVSVSVSVDLSLSVSGVVGVRMWSLV